MAETTRSTTTTTPSTTPEVVVYEHHGVDLSFLQDKSLSKSDMQKKLLQALLELSLTTTTRATTTTTTTTTTTPTTTTPTTTTPTTTTPKTTPGLDLSFLSDGSLSAAEIQMKLLPLLMQLNSQATSPAVPVPVATQPTTTVEATTKTSPLTATASSGGVPEDIAGKLQN